MNLPLPTIEFHLAGIVLDPFFPDHLAQHAGPVAGHAHGHGDAYRRAVGAFHPRVIGHREGQR
jgi:hypothetical protein